MGCCCMSIKVVVLDSKFDYIDLGMLQVTMVILLKSRGISSCSDGTSGCMVTC